MDTLRYIASTGMVGAGFYESSIQAGVEMRPSFIGCDAGSSDPGPYQLGSGGLIFSSEACARDLALSYRAARQAGVPLLVGSCGGAGTNVGVDHFADLISQIVRSEGGTARVARIYAEPDRALLAERYRERRIRPLVGAPSIDEAQFHSSKRIVAMMGIEPFQAALADGADVVLAGRSSDASIFAAIPDQLGYDRGLIWHAAKIMECGSAAISNRTGQDCILCTLSDDHFVVEPLREGLRCTPTSVAAHTLYETADPFHLVEPSGTLDTSLAVYEALDDRRVRVSGSGYQPADVYTVKLEGAELVGYQSITMGGVRDPVILRQLDSWLDSMRENVLAKIEASTGLAPDKYHLAITAYGRNGVLGGLEPDSSFNGHEAFLLMAVTASTQDEASTLIRLTSHVAMHHPVPEWTGSITGIAHPFAPATVDRGEVYRFNLNHVLELDDPLEVYKIEMEEVR
jgi:Acyclic terpene utilisation family protein AtuA